MSLDALPLRPHRAALGDRSLFPKLRPSAYLNHCGISPPSTAVIDAVEAYLGLYAEEGAPAYLPWMLQRNRLRGRISELIGASSPEHIALTQSTTRAIIDTALCFPWSPGDRIVLFTGEFPSNVTPWQRAAEAFGLRISFLPLTTFAQDPEEGVAQLALSLRERTRLVAVSAVQFQTGLKMPLREMAQACHAEGAQLFVDGVQACGVVPMDVVREDIDYLACGSHKWLMGIEGAAFLYAKPELAAAFRPNVAGWMSHEDAFGFLFQGAGLLRYDRPIRKRIDFLEPGNTNAAGFAAMEASLDLILQIGVPNVLAHVTAYLDRLESGLLERGFTSVRSKRQESRSGILSLRAPGASEGKRMNLSEGDIQRALGGHHIACSMPDGYLRFGPHWPNSLDEVPRVLAAVDEVMRGSSA